MIATSIAVAISLFMGLLAAAAFASVVHSCRRGIAGGRAILRELAVIEAGYRPAPPRRTAPTVRKLSAPRRPQPAAPHPSWPQCAAA